MKKLAILRAILFKAQYGLDYFLNAICMNKNLEQLLTHEDRIINTISRSLGGGFGKLPTSAQLLVRILNLICQAEVRELAPNTYFLENMNENERENMKRFVFASILCNIVPALILIERPQYVGRKEKRKKDFLAYLIDFLGEDISNFCSSWREKFKVKKNAPPTKATPRAINRVTRFNLMSDFIKNAAKHISSAEENALEVIDSLRSYLSIDPASLNKILYAFGYGDDLMGFWSENKNGRLMTYTRYHNQEIEFFIPAMNQYIFYDSPRKKKQIKQDIGLEIETSIEENISKKVFIWYQNKLKNGRGENDMDVFRRHTDFSKGTLEIIKSGGNVLDKLIKEYDILLIGEEHRHLDFLDWIDRNINSNQNVIVMLEYFPKNENPNYEYKTSHSFRSVFCRSKHEDFTEKMRGKNILVYGLETDFLSNLFNSITHLKQERHYNEDYKRDALINMLRYYIEKLEGKINKVGNFPEELTYYSEGWLLKIKDYLFSRLENVEGKGDALSILDALYAYFYKMVKENYGDIANFVSKRTEVNKSMTASILKKMEEEPDTKIIVIVGGSHLLDFERNYPGLYTALLSLSSKDISAFVFSDESEKLTIERIGDVIINTRSINSVVNVPYTYLEYS